MHNYHPDASSPIELNNNPRAIERGLNCAIYQHFIYGSDFIPDAAIPGSASVTIPGGGAAYVISAHSFANVDNRASLLFRRPERWLNGIYRIRGIWYTSDIAGGQFRAFVRSSTYTRNQILTAVPPSSMVNPSTNIIVGPTNIYELMYLDCTTDNANLLIINQSIDLIGLLCRRIGTHVDDTNAGVFYLVGIDLEYTEKERFIGENYSNPVYY